MENVTIIAKVVSKSPVIDIKTKKYCSTIIRDETGEIKLNLWRDQVEQVKERTHYMGFKYLCYALSFRRYALQPHPNLTELWLIHNLFLPKQFQALLLAFCGCRSIF
jgi:hypothetical protein